MLIQQFLPKEIENRVMKYLKTLNGPIINEYKLLNQYVTDVDI